MKSERYLYITILIIRLPFAVCLVYIADLLNCTHAARECPYTMSQRKGMHKQLPLVYVNAIQVEASTQEI